LSAVATLVAHADPEPDMFLLMVELFRRDALRLNFPGCAAAAADVLEAERLAMVGA